MEKVKILEILSRELGIPLEDLEQEEEISMETLPDWDSLTHTKIILALERESGQNFNPLEAAQATSFDSLFEMVR